MGGFKGDVYFPEIGDEPGEYNAGFENNAEIINNKLDTAPVDSVNGQTGGVVLDAEDVGADPMGTADSAVSTHNVSGAAHSDIRDGLDARAWKTVYNDVYVPEDWSLGFGGMFFGESAEINPTAANPLGGVFRITLSYGSVEFPSAVVAMSSRGQNDTAGNDTTWITNQRRTSDSGPCLAKVDYVAQISDPLNNKGHIAFTPSLVTGLTNVKIETLDQFNFKLEVNPPLVGAIGLWTAETALPFIDKVDKNNGTSTDQTLTDPTMSGAVTTDIISTILAGLKNYTSVEAVQELIQEYIYYGNSLALHKATSNGSTFTINYSRLTGATLTLRVNSVGNSTANKNYSIIEVYVRAGSVLDYEVMVEKKLGSDISYTVVVTSALLRHPE